MNNPKQNKDSLNLRVWNVWYIYIFILKANDSLIEIIPLNIFTQDGRYQETLIYFFLVS